MGIYGNGGPDTNVVSVAFTRAIQTVYSDLYLHEILL